MAATAFTISVPDAVLEGISKRLAQAAIGYAPADDPGDWRYGMDRGHLVDLVDYWRDHYDWRAAEAALNQLPQYKARVDGLDLHFIHARAPGGGFPLILTHGWPGSVVEFQEAIPRLVAQGFDVVAPSLPGYAWSGRPAGPIGPAHVAGLWRKLMTETLGYRRFGAQGGDWGSAVTAWLGRDHSDVVAAIHLNLFRALRPQGPDQIEELEYWQRLGEFTMRESAYMLEHMTKPQTIGLALHDNPVGFTAWVIEKFHGWSDAQKPFDQRFTRDQLITNLMTYLVNDAVISSIWLYRGVVGEDNNPQRIEVPTGLALYPGEFYPYPPRAAAERAFNLHRWSEMPRGGHFAAMEAPGDFADDLAAFFRDFA